MRTWDRLSATFVRGLKKPGKYYDGGGLMLQATPTRTKDGVSKAWLFRFQIDHRERVMGLGSARVVTAELHTATFRQCLDGFLISHGDRWRAKHANQWRNSMMTYAKPLFDVAVGDIDTAMVIKIIEPEWKRAPQTMDRVRRRIGEVLGFAEVRGLRKA